MYPKFQVVSELVHGLYFKFQFQCISSTNIYDILFSYFDKESIIKNNDFILFHIDGPLNKN